MPLSNETLSKRIPMVPESSNSIEAQVYVGKIREEDKPPIAEIASEKPLISKKVSGIKVLGAGMTSGGKIVPNEDLAELGYDSEWIVQRTGIKSRYHLAEGETTSDMAIRASEQCIANAGIDASEIDLIVVATISPDYKTPSTACQIQGHLGCEASALDINAACAGFMYALVTASQFVKSGCSRNALVVGAEAVTSFVDEKDFKTFPLFGDGAGAMLITADGNPDESTASGILAYQLGSDGSQADKLCVPGGGTKNPFSQEVLDTRSYHLAMDGRAVFKWAVRLIPSVVSDLLASANMSIKDIDLFVPHQANVRIIDAAVADLGIDREKVFVNLDRFGNTSAASIPIAIAEAVQQGRIKKGDNVMMIGFGAGLSWGACLYRW